jgi:amino acid transporter
MFKQMFARKSLETLHKEMEGDNRLRRVLGPIGLTSLGVGAIIGSGIFFMTGRVAAQDAGPALMLSFVVAGIGCVFAALCYAEFASTAPVAGSAYTYSYATLGEIFAWIIGWDLILEYAMACACVAAAWSAYFNKFLDVCFNITIPIYLRSDPFSNSGAWFNLPAVVIILLVTAILVIGIRESATANAVLVGIKVGVVLFVIGAGIQFINPSNWTSISVAERHMPEERDIKDFVDDFVKQEIKDKKITEAQKEEREATLQAIVEIRYREEVKLNLVEEQVKKGLITKEEAARSAEEVKKETEEKLDRYRIDVQQALIQAQNDEGKISKKAAEQQKEEVANDKKNLGQPSAAEMTVANELLAQVRGKAADKRAEKWGLLGMVGLNRWLLPLDDAVRSPFAPYGLSGIIFGASIVFFAYIGFDSISTHSEEAKRPKRDVPLAILISLVLCTILYIAVAAVITGMVPYPNIDPTTALASAFKQKAETEHSSMLLASSGLIATGALAGMTSVLLITFLSQARIFLAMARDGLLPPAIFGAVHPVFKTPHRSTMLTGGLMALVAAFTPILKLEEMVNIGTLLAFVMVCAAVLMLRITRPDAQRPFRTPVVWFVAPAGVIVNTILMLFLPVDTWLRLVIWLAIGLCIYFGYGMRNSVLGKKLA